MNIKVVYPSAAHSAYKIAAKTFASLAEQVAGCKAELVTAEEYTAPSGDLTVFIGNDEANFAVAELLLSMKIDAFGIRYGSDDYAIRTAEIDGAKLLMLAGGRPRAAIYAVYRYFELYCGCRWFWDGDRMKNVPLTVSGIDVLESPQFYYRGLRYFAHRSLHRFQAEQWSLEEWQTEIDWMLKKRLNLFMLRIGMDDLFQKTFPELVNYPERDEKLPEAGPGYDDRTLFWSLRYRGELRKKILAYAFERDLFHPEDCGTMTHWYSRTPKDFLDRAKPELLPQTSRHYADPTGRVWDIRKDENFENYFKLTKKHIEEYGKPEIFHTIGLGERRYSTDREANQRMKLYVYRKIAARVKRDYPNAPLFIASWDLWQQFTADEVRALTAELDPEQAVIFDYTSDTKNRTNYREWGVVGKFPWVFGIFSAFEPNSEIRGLYGYTNELLAEAKKDPMCKGLILWPELSHGDPFVIEYFAKNAWEKETKSIGERIDDYCADRYPAYIANEMRGLWHKFMPIVELDAWSTGGDFHPYGDDLFFDLKKKTEFCRDNANDYAAKVKRYAKHKAAGAEILRALAEIQTDDAMAVRDIFDISRTVLSRYINAGIYKVEELYAVGAPAEELRGVMDICEALMGSMIDLLGQSSDFSLLDSLRRLHEVTETNPNFEATLKNNASCSYCRSFIYENAKYLYLPEMKAMFDRVEKCAKTGEIYEFASVADCFEKIGEVYHKTPLKEMERENISLNEILNAAADRIDDLAL